MGKIKEGEDMGGKGACCTQKVLFTFSIESLPFILKYSGPVV